jgi:aspartokinase
MLYGDRIFGKGFWIAEIAKGTFMAQERIKAYKIVSYQFLTFVRMAFSSDSGAPLSRVLENFQQRSLPIRFLATDVSSQGELELNLGVDLLSEEMVDEVIEELESLQNRNDLSVISQVSMALVYGPHFGEVPGIASLALSTLSSAGITILATSASASSLSCLFPAMQFKAALETFHAIFEPPQENLYWRDNHAEVLR